MFGKENKQGTEVATVEPTPLQMIQQVISTPGFDVTTLEKMMVMQERWEDREAKKAFNVAMSEVQAELPRVLPDATNKQTSSDYATLKQIAGIIKPVYTSHGFSASFSRGKAEVEGNIRVDAVLRHCDGHSEAYFQELPPDKAGIAGKVNKTDVHAAASAFTYCRRYLVCGIFDVVVGADTDGNPPQDAEYISDEQVANIESLLTETGINRANFLQYAMAGSVDKILISNYATIIHRLEDKR